MATSPHRYSFRQFGGLNTSSPADSLPVGLAVAGSNFRLGSASGGSRRALAPAYGRSRLYTPYRMADKLETVSATATVSNGSATLADLAIEGVEETPTGRLLVGMRVTGTGIPLNTTIESLDTGTQLTLSREATADGSEVALVFTRPPRIAVYLVDATEDFGAMEGTVLVAVDHASGHRVVAMGFQKAVQSDFTPGDYAGDVGLVPDSAYYLHYLWEKWYRFTDTSGVLALATPSWSPGEDDFPPTAGGGWFAGGGSTLWITDAPDADGDGDIEDSLLSAGLEYMADATEQVFVTAHSLASATGYNDWGKVKSGSGRTGMCVLRNGGKAQNTVTVTLTASAAPPAIGNDLWNHFIFDGETMAPGAPGDPVVFTASNMAEGEARHVSLQAIGRSSSPSSTFTVKLTAAAGAATDIHNFSVKM